LIFPGRRAVRPRAVDRSPRGAGAVQLWVSIFRLLLCKGLFFDILGARTFEAG
jgi:hypothetical protein